MRVHAKIERSTVNGPGVRAVVFLQGCSLACPGCQNPETHQPNRGEFMTSVELADWILSREGITAVTFSGGEPLEQLEDGLDLTIGIVRDRRPDFSIGIFTGYTQQELGAGNFRWTPAEYEWKYAAEKIQTLGEAGIIGKTKYRNWQKRAKGKTHLGAWQCAHCPFKAKCVSVEYPEMLHQIADLMVVESEDEAA